MTEKQELSFEDAYRELEATVQRLEEGDLALEEAIAAYERGMRLVRRCQAVLDAAQLRVEQIGSAPAPAVAVEG